MISLDFSYSDYYYENKLDKLLSYEYDQLDLYKPGFVFDIDGKDPFAPDCDDFNWSVTSNLIVIFGELLAVTV